MKLIESSAAQAAANPRIPNPFLKLKLTRFPTSREIQAAFVELAADTTMPAPLVDRFFPESNTLATEIEMYVTRQDSKGYVGMTFPHQLETEVRTMDGTARVDIAKASWAPIHFKEAKAWGERQMLELSRLGEDVQGSQINGEIAEFLAIMQKRRKARKEWMCWSVLRHGKILIDSSTPDNPNRLKYSIDYGVTDHEILMPIKLDDKDVDGHSRIDPTEWIGGQNRAAKYTNRKIVEIVVNSNFVEYLTDNTFMRTIVDYERGANTLEKINPPRALYRSRVLEAFTRLTGVTVTFNDDTYEDAAGQQHYWFPDGEAMFIYQNTGPFGTFVNTGHIQAGAGDGSITVGTGDYAYAVDRTRDVKPTYEIISGFSGLPQLKGYDVLDFGYHRFKWVKYASNGLDTNLVPALPKRQDGGIGDPL